MHEPRLLAWGLAAFVFGILGATSILATLDGSPTVYIRFGQAAFFSLAIWVVLLAALRRVWLVLTLALPFALLLPVDLWMRLEMGQPISSRAVALAMETSPSEAANFLLTYGTRLAFLFLAWIILYLTTVWLAYRHKLAWRNRANIWVLLIIPAIIGIQFLETGAPTWVNDDPSIDPFDGKGVAGWSLEWEDTFPVNLVVAFQHYNQEMKRLEKTQNALNQQSQNGALLKPDSAPEVVVLVVGESATANHWSLLGYPRKTTPRLEAESNLVAFSNVVSLSTSTRSAVPLALSRRPVLRPDGTVDLQAEPSLIKAFGEAGYQTHWFSNQTPFGKHDTSITVYAREANNVRFLNPSTFKSKSSLDELLLEPLSRVVNSPGRHLVILHTLGSHFEYALRYPDSFDHFTPSTKKIGVSDTKQDVSKEQVTNSYDNSIVYADHVLSEVIRIVKAQDGRGFVAYFSDHGIDLPGGKCQYNMDMRGGESSYRVPVFFWFSQQMKQDHTVQWQQLQKNKDEPMTTRAMFATLLELGGVRITGEYPSENFLRQDQPKKSPRMVAVGNKMVDFDLAVKRNACRISP
jgi:glucan phosphoethanolaminetransferase (alkaline phosphatase superfamily)